MANGYDFRNFAGAQGGTGLVGGLISGLGVRGSAQLKEDQLARQRQQDVVGALKYGINPTRLNDEAYLQEIAQQRQNIANRPLGTSEIERLAIAIQDESLPQDIRNAYTARIQTLSKDPTALYSQSQQSELGKLEAQQQIRPSLEQEIARSKGLGQAQAEREIAAPKSIGQADRILTTIEDVLQDTEGQEQSLGGVGGLVGRQAQSYPLTEAQRRFIPKVEQLQGQTFLQAFESLKGGGQITEIEGKKATEAIARLNTVQSPADFRKALQDLKDIVNNAKQRATRGTSFEQQAIQPQETQSNVIDWSEL